MATLIYLQIDDWKKRGIIDAPMADLLRKDIAENGVKSPWVRRSDKPQKKRRFSFFQVLIVFAAICFIAGVALLIASNWEVIPRLVRTGAVLLLIPIGLLGGVFVRNRFGSKIKYAEEACYLIGGGAFVSAVALIAQMYHISGDGRSAALLYAIGLGVGALALRSLVLCGLALFFWCMWHVNGPFAADMMSAQFWAYFIALGAAYGAAVYMASSWAKRMVFLAFGIGVLPLFAEIFEWILSKFGGGIEWFFNLPDGVRQTVWIVLLIASIGALIHQYYKRGDAVPTRRQGLRQGLKTAGAFFLGCVSLLGLHEFADKDWVAFILAFFVIGFVLLMLYLHGQHHRILRYICYAIFLAEIFYLYVVTISSMVSTSGFLILLAGFLCVVATVIYRLERRFNKTNKADAQ